MSALYLTASSDAIKTLRTARGHHYVKAALQSYEGSLQITMDRSGNVEITTAKRSSSIPEHRLYVGTIADLLAARELTTT